VVVESSHTPDSPNNNQMVFIGYGMYGFVRLSFLNGGLIVFFSFLLLYGLIQPGGSAPNEGDKVMA
jgi:hypothetical protein